MADKKPLDTSLEEEAKKLIETLDKLAYEKPAGFQGFLAVCGSSMKLSDFRELSKDETISTDAKK